MRQPGPSPGAGKLLWDWIPEARWALVDYPAGTAKLGAARAHRSGMEVHEYTQGAD
jgi:hypothetical protein